MKTQDPKKRAILESFKNGLIVSCQVQWDDPIYTDDMVVKMAEGARWAGAVGIRANSPEQIRAIKEKVDLPMIGLYKIWHDDTDVFITPTLEAAREVWEAGAEIIALDCTDQITHEGRPAWELLPIVQKEIPEAMIFADVSTTTRPSARWSWARTSWAPPSTATQRRPPPSSIPTCASLPACAATWATRHTL